MYHYLTLIFVVGGISLGYKKILPKIFIAIFCALLIFIMHGFRLDAGNDYFGYINMLSLDLTSKSVYLRELYFQLMHRFIFTYNLEPEWFFAISSYLTYTLLLLATIQFNFVPAFFLIVSGYSFFANDQIRQALAISFFLYLHFFHHMGIRKAAFCAFFVFHFSAIVVLIVSFFTQVVTIRTIPYALVLALILYIFLGTNLDLEAYVNFLPGILVQRFLGDDNFIRVTERSLSTTPFLLTLLALSFHYVYMKVGGTLKLKYNIEAFYKLSTFLLVFHIVFFEVFIVNRAFSYGVYFLLFCFGVIVDGILKKQKVKHLPLLNISIGISVCTLLFAGYIYSDGGRHGGYHFRHLIFGSEVACNSANGSCL